MKNRKEVPLVTDGSCGAFGFESARICSGG